MSDFDLNIALDPREIERLQGMLQLSKEACRRAAKRAVRKAAKWTEGQAARATSNELKLAQRVIRSRLRLYEKGDGLTQKIYLGLNALAAHRLGIPKRQGSGTRVGQHFFEGAFPIARYGGGVYRRQGADRFPLELVKLEISEVGARALRSAAIRAEDRLLTLMRQELNYEFERALQR